MVSFELNTMNMLRIVFSGLALVSAFSFFTSCGNESSNSGQGKGEVNYDTVTSTVDDLKQFKYDLTISNIPIPFDILATLSSSQALFQKSLLNPPDNLVKYSESHSKAINLGIFGADMAYVICFERYQEVTPYLKCTKKLADELGIPIAFDQKALASFERNKSNKDSLEKIIFSSYAEVDKTLKSNERIGLASLVVTGGWLEGLYTTVQTALEGKGEIGNKLNVKILQQRSHLNALLDLLGEFKSEPFFAALIEDLQQIKNVYGSLSDKNKITRNELQTLGQKVELIRNKIIRG
jgi:hypothetical protein